MKERTIQILHLAIGMVGLRLYIPVMTVKYHPNNLSYSRLKEVCPRSKQMLTLCLLGKNRFT